MNRIKSLDGIRAISIIMVLLGHAKDTMSEGFAHNVIFSLFANSSLGVKIFFVISGFLITKLLLAEREKTGKIDVKDFYLRRIFRIFPVFYLYILVIVILKLTILPNIFNSYSLIGFAVIYIWNYKHLFISDGGTPDNGNWFFGHLWSLSMEEQFYLIWPVMFIKIKKETLIKVVAVILLLMPLVRIATYFLMPDSRGQIIMMLHTGGDSILTGCLAALLFESSIRFKELVTKYITKGYLVAIAALFLFILSPVIALYLKGAYSITIGQTLNNLAIIFLLFWCIYVPSKFADVLNSTVLVRIGILSYSLYIWQQLFLTNLNDLWVNKFPQNIFVVAGVACVSYYLIEKPILKLKKRLKKV